MHSTYAIQRCQIIYHGTHQSWPRTAINGESRSTTVVDKCVVLRCDGVEETPGDHSPFPSAAALPPPPCIPRPPSPAASSPPPAGTVLTAECSLCPVLLFFFDTLLRCLLVVACGTPELFFFVRVCRTQLYLACAPLGWEILDGAR
jgi:hypothetical protein